MCGRARCTLSAEGAGAACGFSGRPLRAIDTNRYRPSYNVSPGSYLPVVRFEADGDTREPVVHCMKWGLVPSFTKKSEKPDHYRMFNARSESVRQKSSFSRLLPKRRCLISVEGFYEWKKDGAKKQPYYIHLQDGHPLVFGGLYDSWQNAEGETLFTFTILTTQASKRLEWLHDRMPVILANEEAMNAWMKQKFPEDVFHKLVHPYEGPNLVWYPVTPAMGKASFDGPECIKQIKHRTSQNNDISKLFKRKAQESKPEERHDSDKPLNADEEGGGAESDVLHDAKRAKTASGSHGLDSEEHKTLLTYYAKNSD